MPYCKRCQLLCGEKCPVCGRKTRAPQGNDPVLLLMVGHIHASMIEPILDESEIPYAKIGMLGSGITLYTSPALETFRFYVPYAAFEQCRALIETTFGEDEEVMSQLRANVEN